MKFINLVYKNATHAVYMTDNGRFAVIENQEYNTGDMRFIEICDNAKTARKRADMLNRYDGANMPNDFVLHTQESPYPTGNDALSTSLREIFFKHNGDNWVNEPYLYDVESPFYQPLSELLAEEEHISEFVRGIESIVKKLQQNDEMPPPASARHNEALDRLRSMLGTLEGED